MEPFDIAPMQPSRSRQLHVLDAAVLGPLAQTALCTVLISRRSSRDFLRRHIRSDGHQFSIQNLLERAPIGHDRRVGRVFQRWVVQAVRMSRRMMMTALANAMRASMTWVQRSVQTPGFRNVHNSRLSSAEISQSRRTYFCLPTGNRTGCSSAAWARESGAAPPHTSTPHVAAGGRFGQRKNKGRPTAADRPSGSRRGRKDQKAGRTSSSCQVSSMYSRTSSECRSSSRVWMASFSSSTLRAARKLA